MSDLPSIEEYRATMVRIGRLATQLHKYATDRCWTIGGLTSGAMDNARELESRVRAALKPSGLGRPESEGDPR